MNQPQQQTPPEAWTERTRLLFGDDRVSELAQCHVLIVGLGGVGGFAAELIARAGIGRMTIVDADIVQPSNINRQLVATTETIGEAKASVLAARLRAINPHIQLEVIEAFLKDENMIELLDRHRYDYVIDAIDSLSPKVHLIAKSIERGLPIISSMGAGAKSDPTQIHQADLNKSYNCTLARALRKRLRKFGIHKGLPVVFSRLRRRQGDRGRAVQALYRWHCLLYARALRLSSGGLRHPAYPASPHH